MIKLEAFIDDKKVARVLHALDGLVIQMTMGPVHNAVTKAKKVAGAGQPTTGPEVIQLAINQAPYTENKKAITRKALMEMGKTYGIADSAIASAIQSAKEAKIIKQKSYGNYLIQTTGVKNG